MTAEVLAGTFTVETVKVADSFPAATVTLAGTRAADGFELASAGRGGGVTVSVAVLAVPL